jgi:hypothetical protein
MTELVVARHRVMQYTQSLLFEGHKHSGGLRAIADWLDAHPTFVLLGVSASLDYDGNGIDDFVFHVTVEDPGAP